LNDCHSPRNGGIAPGLRQHDVPRTIIPVPKVTILGTGKIVNYVSSGRMTAELVGV